MANGMPAVRRVGGLFRVAPLMTIGAVAGAGMLTMTPPGAPSVFATTHTASAQTRNVELTGFFIGNGTQTNPNAGLLIGSGYNYTAFDNTY
jgi:opacity protein-like surface antigen